LFVGWRRWPRASPDAVPRFSVAERAVSVAVW
jgi:hypothetical protein